MFSAVEWGAESADGYIDEIGQAALLIARYPGVGTFQRYRSRIYQRWNVRSHAILYRAERTTIVIVRILHAARDMPRRTS